MQSNLFPSFGVFHAQTHVRKTLQNFSYRRYYQITKCHSLSKLGSGSILAGHFDKAEWLARIEMRGPVFIFEV